LSPLPLPLPPTLTALTPLHSSSAAAPPAARPARRPQRVQAASALRRRTRCLEAKPSGGEGEEEEEDRGENDDRNDDGEDEAEGDGAESSPPLLRALARKEARGED